MGITVGLIVVLLIIALIIAFVPGLDPTLKKLLLAVGIIATVVWALIVLGLVGGNTTTIRL